MSKARDEYYQLKVDVFLCSHGGLVPAVENYVSEIEAERAELMELIADINRRIKSGSFNIPMYENYYMSDVDKLLKKYKGNI